jgi:hypothetical protein
MSSLLPGAENEAEDAPHVLSLQAKLLLRLNSAR